MSFTDDANRKEDIVVTIPTGCAAGNVCGDINNTTVSCQWEMTLSSVSGDVFAYKFSKTMSGECPALGGGTLTLQSDGTLMRAHKMPDWAGTQTLTLKDGKSLGVWHGLQGQTAKCQANYEVVGNVVRFTYYTDADECLGEVDEIQWRLDDEGLHFHVIDIKNAPITEVTAVWEAKPWQKLADQ